VNTIVVGYDGSEHADRALDRAVQLAGTGAQLVVVSSARLETGGAHPRGSASPVDPGAEEAAIQALDKARARLNEKGVEGRTLEAHGDAADVLVREAEAVGADLIIVGTRGHNAAQRALLGSVSTRVVHHAHCDVLVVR
jgi:nucleotide-binding universal stress UspA family protein